jgi:hypothetical protein
MRELELKLSVDDPFVTPALRPDGVDVAGMEELPELDLLRHTGSAPGPSRRHVAPSNR